MLLEVVFQHIVTLCVPRIQSTPAIPLLLCKHGVRVNANGDCHMPQSIMRRAEAYLVISRDISYSRCVRSIRTSSALIRLPVSKRK